MARENAHDKARRLLTEGRVNLHRVNARSIGATVRGDTAAVYSVAFTGGRWWCSCPARSIRCAHVQAVQLCTVVQQHPDTEGGTPPWEP